MKILFLTNIPSPYRVDFFNELGKKCELTVLFERHNAKDREENWLNNKATSFNAIYLEGIKVGNDSALCFSVIKWLKDKRFNIIVVGVYSTPTGMLAIEYMRFKRISFILNADGGFIKSENKFRYYLKKFFISSASAWLSTAEVTDDYLVNYGAKKENIYRYPFTSLKSEDILKEPVDIESKIKIRKELNINYDKMIVSVGQFIHRKGFDVLLKACSYMENEIGVYIIGGEPTNEYLSLKSKLSLHNVHFEGFKTKEELWNYYKAADLFVLPTREDIWGLVVNEAMACGLPVITTDKCIAGLELVINKENGYIVEADDFKQLARKVNYLINNEGLKLIMSQKCLETIKEYTIENMSLKHKKIFSNEIQ